MKIPDKQKQTISYTPKPPAPAAPNASRPCRSVRRIQICSVCTQRDGSGIPESHEIQDHRRAINSTAATAAFVGERSAHAAQEQHQAGLTPVPGAPKPWSHKSRAASIPPPWPGLQPVQQGSGQRRSQQRGQQREGTVSPRSCRLPRCRRKNCQKLI